MLMFPSNRKKKKRKKKKIYINFTASNKTNSWNSWLQVLHNTKTLSETCHVNNGRNKQFSCFYLPLGGSTAFGNFDEVSLGSDVEPRGGVCFSSSYGCHFILPTRWWTILHNDSRAVCTPCTQAIGSFVFAQTDAFPSARALITSSSKIDPPPLPSTNWTPFPKHVGGEEDQYLGLLISEF
jgi:hypothetical protein